MCKELDTAKIGPTVIAGMDAIVAPHGRTTNDEWVLGHMTSLLGSVYLYVWNSVSAPNGVDGARYVQARKAVVQVLEYARLSVRIKDMDEEEAWHGWEDIRASDIDDAALRINRYGWLESDWAKGIEDLVQRDEDADAGEHGGDEDTATRIGQIRRSDTMFQDKYDYLSERKRKEYAAWKASILRRIEAIEAGNTDPMEIDPESE